MKTKDLILRCYARKTDDQWVAVCIDLCLAAQASSFQEAKKLLSEQITDYVEEALTVDQEFAAELLSRKAPLSQRFEYFLILASHKIHVAKDGLARVFKTNLPVHVGSRCHA